MFIHSFIYLSLECLLVTRPADTKMKKAQIFCIWGVHSILGRQTQIQSKCNLAWQGLHRGNQVRGVEAQGGASNKKQVFLGQQGKAS